jgi:hypothetical protein
VALGKATAIIDALAACLDHERGGEIAANLDRIYTYVSFRLQRVNLTDDVAICDQPGFPGCRLLRADFAPLQRARQGCKGRNVAGTSRVVPQRRFFQATARARGAFEQFQVDHGRTSPAGL